MKQEFTYKTQGVCSSAINIAVDGDTITEVKFIGGCPGNLLGIGKLVQGKKMADVAAELQGIRCGGKATSCPDQLSKALLMFMEQQKK